MNNEVFFDSHGHGWITCPLSHPEAEAFGPGAAARRLKGLHYTDVRTSTFVADGWTYLDGPGWDEEGRPAYYG